MTIKKQDSVCVEKPLCFGFWFDSCMYPLSRRVIPFIANFNWITPNFVTLFSFLLYVSGCLLIIIDIPYHQYFVAVLLVTAYLGDIVDGQLARFKKLSSSLGCYLDNVVDALKNYIIIFALSCAAYLNTNNVTYVFLGFIACFFFNFRYFIKLDTLLGQAERDSEYFNKCSQRFHVLLNEIENKYQKLSKGFINRVKLFWLKNRIIFWVEDGALVVFTSLAVLFDKIEIVLWIFAVSQALIAFWRLFQRGYQIHKNQDKLLDPIRK